MVDTVPGWSDERVDHLRRLWEEGLSASRIATQIGGVTRNAVIGKIHRLGLSGRVKSPDMAGSAPDRAIGEDEANPDPVADGPPLKPMRAEVEPVSTARVALTVSRRVTIMDLREAMCRWPIGDPTAPDFHYCGDRSITGLPYCAAHSQIAYQPAAERKRDRRIGGFR